MPRNRIAPAIALAALTAVALVGCASAGASDTNSAGGGTASSGEFPVTIEHAFGETVIEAQPERVATVSWSNQEVPLALGVVPVGMAEVTWGDVVGVGELPWVED